MKLSTLFRLLTRGFSSADPRIEEEAKRIENEEARKLAAKEAVLKGFRRVLHFDDLFSISRWFREVGHGIEMGSVNQLKEIELWQRGEHFRLAVKKDEWEVYVIIPERTSYQLRRRVA